MPSSRKGSSVSKKILNFFPDLRTEGQREHDKRAYDTAVLEGWLENREEYERNERRRGSSGSDASSKKSSR